MGQTFDDFVELGFTADDFSDEVDTDDEGGKNDGLPADEGLFDFDADEAALLAIVEKLDKADDKSDKSNVNNDADDADDEEEEDDDKSSNVNLDLSLEKKEVENLVEFLKNNKWVNTSEDFKIEEGDSVADIFSKLFEENSIQTMKAAQSSFLDSLSEDMKLAAKYSLVNKGATFNDFIDYYNNNISVSGGELDLTQVNLEEEQDQINVFKHYLKQTTQYSDDKISKQIELLKKSGELYGESKDALSELVALEAKAKIDFEKRQDEYQKSLEEAERKSRLAIQKVLSENKDLQPERSKKIANFINNKIKLENGVETNLLWKTVLDLSKNSEHLVQLADLVIDYDPQKGLNLDRLIAKGKAKKTREIKDDLDNKSKNQPPTGNPRKRNPPSFDWEAWALGGS